MKTIGNKSGLEAFLATIQPDTIQPDEWTAKMAHERMGKKSTLASVRNQLIRQNNDGVLSSRRVLIGGTWVRVYKSAR